MATVTHGGVVVLGVLTFESLGRPSPSVRSTGNDAFWLGHAWVDGRKSQSDVEALAAQLRGTGIRDLFVHTGPFENDGSLDPGRHPRSRWFTEAVHATLPGVRVQAWLGAHPVPGQIALDSAPTRHNLLRSIRGLLDGGFDGIHYDFEPIADGDPHLLTVLREARSVTRERGALLSVSAIHNEPWAGVAVCVTAIPGPLALWSTGYLRLIAAEVDQVAVMSYDTAIPTQAAYGGYVRLATQKALAAVPPEVTLFMGLPAYDDERWSRWDSAETVSAALRGIRLALGDRPPARRFGVAIYVDFTIDQTDWASYRDGWSHPAG